MAVVQQILVLLHLIGFASLFGGFLVQLRVPHPEVNAAMLHGTLTQLVTGLALLWLAEMGTDPVNHLMIGIKLGITLLITILVVMNRKFDSIPKGLWAIIGGMTLINAALSVFWQ